jgi:hypothetical protein
VSVRSRNTLPVTPGSGALACGAAPVLVRMPNGLILFNAAGSGDVWTNASGSSSGAWTQQHTTMAPAYSRSLSYVPYTGRVEIVGGDLPRGHRLRELHGLVLQARQRRQR